MPTSLVSTGVQFPDSTIQTTAASASPGATAVGSIVMMSMQSSSISYPGMYDAGVNSGIYESNYYIAPYTNINIGGTLYPANLTSIQTYAASGYNNLNTGSANLLPSLVNHNLSGTSNVPTVTGLVWHRGWEKWVGSTVSGRYVVLYVSSNGINWVPINFRTPNFSITTGYPYTPTSVMWNRYSGATTSAFGYRSVVTSDYRVLYFTNSTFTDTQIFTSINDVGNGGTIDNGSSNVSIIFYGKTSTSVGVMSSSNLTSWSALADITGVSGGTYFSFRAPNVVTNSTAAYILQGAGGANVFIATSSGSTGKSDPGLGSGLGGIGANDSYILVTGTSAKYSANVNSTTPTWSALTSPPSWGTTIGCFWTGAAWIVVTEKGFYVNTNTNPNSGTFTLLQASGWDINIGNSIFSNGSAPIAIACRTV